MSISSRTPSVTSISTDLEQPAGHYARALAERLGPLALREGFSATGIKGVELMFSDCHRPREPLIYEAGLKVVVQGGKRGYLGDREIYYGAGHYLVQAMPLPFECETVASVTEPLLGISITLDRLALGELVAQFPNEPQPSEQLPTPMAAVPIDDNFGDALLRLTECFSDPVKCRALGSGRLQEVIFAALCGPQGVSLRRLITDQGHYVRIAEALQFMHDHYMDAMSIEQLARSAHMSVSHFHHHFKRTTQQSPLQYLKRLRLLKARAMLLGGDRQVAQAALAVGYRSTSQFSREYKHYFGSSPGKSAALA
ncbi:AraC family transcriptional regulator [Carnimonas nigrificans]|uniref:AraC family transcriptional regulator n=1 Tax=Carnimonas nigrificans TaxID=64323 RepID=UPI0004712122|nr:AraC family transcriptional regulator [Carnimonas nigrificans]